MNNFVPEMFTEQRGVKAKYNFILEINEQREYPASEAKRIRSALIMFRKRNYPKWQFITTVRDGKLLIARIK